MIDIGSWPRPQWVELSGTVLKWRTFEDLPPVDDVEAAWAHDSARLFGEFVRLKDDAEGKGILSFAKRWGALRLCRHQLPERHGLLQPTAWILQALGDREWMDTPRASADPAAEQKRVCEPLVRDGWSLERLSSWRRFATVISLIARIAQEERSARAPSLELWNEILPGEDVADLASYPRYFQMGRRLGGGRARPITFDPVKDRRSAVQLRVALLVDDLLRLGDVRVGFEWSGPAPETSFHVGGLLGALAVHLASAVAGTSGLAICSACGNSHVPKRRPARGRRTYCEVCGASGIPVRDAQRDQRRRKAEARLDASGGRGRGEAVAKRRRTKTGQRGSGTATRRQVAPKVRRLFATYGPFNTSGVSSRFAHSAIAAS